MSHKKTDPKTVQQIDENLKRVFDVQLQQELPDRLKDLLAQLKARDAGKDTGAEK